MIASQVEYLELALPDLLLLFLFPSFQSRFIGRDREDPVPSLLKLEIFRVSEFRSMKPLMHIVGHSVKEVTEEDHRVERDEVLEGFEISLHEDIGVVFLRTKHQERK